MSEYLLDNRAVQAGDRMGALSALFDRVTDHHFEAIGVGPDWRCWEVGAGGIGVPLLLAERASSGSVLATDIEIGWLERAPARVEVRQHDVRDELPGTGFDLIHARLVLGHLVEREDVLHKLTTALRPGGWLFIEDFDAEIESSAFMDPSTDIERLGNKIRLGFIDLLRKRGAVTTFGRTLPRLFREAGLVDIVADGRLTLAHPGGAELEYANIDQVRAGLVAQNYATEDEIDAYLAALAELIPTGPPLISVYGRRAP